MNFEKYTDFLSFFPDCVIQTFDDREKEYGEKSKELTKVGPAKGFPEIVLRSMNEKNSAGIFFTPNRFPSGRRTKDQCTGVNAWYIESDDLSIDEQLKRLTECKLTPTFMVRSKKSIHAYWIAKDATIENFEKIEKGLIEYFSGDNAMKDISRVLRIPTFWHNKNPNDRFKVELIDVNPELSYSESDMLVHFPCKEEEKKPVFNKPFVAPNTTAIPKTDNLWEALVALDTKMMLEKLSGDDIVKNEVFDFERRGGDGGFYIIVNGKRCNAWLDKDNKIGSPAGGGPTWIQWIEYYKVTKGEIAKWAMDNLADMLPASVFLKSEEYKARKAVSPQLNISQPIVKPVEKKVEESKIDLSVAERLKNKINSPKFPFTWGTLALNRALPAILSKNLVVFFGSSGTGKSLYTLFLAKENVKTVNGVGFLSLEMNMDQIYMRYCRDRAGIRKEHYDHDMISDKIVDKFLPELEGIKFFGIDKGESYDVAKIRKLITENNLKLLIVDNLNKIQGKGKSEFEISMGVSTDLLNITRDLDVTLLIIHHTSKPKFEKFAKTKDIDAWTNRRVIDKIDFKGPEGMRGTQKIFDDADVVVEIARVKVPPDVQAKRADNTISFVPNENSLEFQIKKEQFASGLNVYKDREWGTSSKKEIYFYEGNFYDEYKMEFIKQNNIGLK